MTSAPETHTPPAPEPSENRLLISAAAWVGVILIIVLVFAIAYNYKRDGGPVDPAVAQRRQTLAAEVNVKQLAAISEYAVMGETVRVPVERAMEYVLPALNAKPVQAVAAPPAQPPAQESPAPAEQPATEEPAAAEPAPQGN